MFDIAFHGHIARNGTGRSGYPGRTVVIRLEGEVTIGGQGGS